LGKAEKGKKGCKRQGVVGGRKATILSLKRKVWGRMGEKKTLGKKKGKETF